MEFTFNNIFYDNSAVKPKDQVETERSEYPGIGALISKLENAFSGKERNLDNTRLYEVGKIKFTIRYRGYHKETENNLSWGGVPTDEDVIRVYAIKGEEDGKYSLYVTDSNFVKKKIGKNERTGTSKSWGISADDRKSSDIYGSSEKKTINEINDKIEEDIKNLLK